MHTIPHEIQQLEFKWIPFLFECGCFLNYRMDKNSKALPECLGIDELHSH